MKGNEEILHVYSADGEPLAECDLGARGASVMVAFADGKFEFIESAANGTTVVAALVRDEDGWTLVAADPSRPVISGNKETTDVHLVAGLPSRLGEWVFRLERSAQESGTALVWRYRGSSFVVDRLIAGRNIVGSDRMDGDPLVNPTLAKEVLCELYPSEAGLEVVVPGSSDGRLSVGMQELFSIGGFEGMLLTAADAAAAIKMRDPFAWPSRSQRTLIRISAFFLVLLFAAAFAVNGLKSRYEAELAEARGAVEVAYAPERLGVALSDQATIYTIAFFRALPQVLIAEPNAITLDLIRRGGLLSDNDDIRRKVKFLKTVREIQETIKSGRWDEFAVAFESADREMFGICDADDFLHDAKQVYDCLTRKLPRKLADASEHGKSASLGEFAKEIAQSFGDLQHNTFLSGDVLERERENTMREYECMLTYVKARDRLMTVLEDGSTIGEPGAYADLYTVFGDLMSVIGQGGSTDEIYGPMVVRERAVVADIVRRTVNAVISRESADAIGRFASILSPIADLGESVGIPSQEVDIWRAKARVAQKRLDEHYRKLYSEYRIKALTDPQGAEKVLDEIIAVGDERNGFHQWAVKEKGKGKKEEDVK